MIPFLYFVIGYYIISKFLIAPFLFKVILNDWDNFCKNWIKSKSSFHRANFLILIMRLIKFTTFSFSADNYRFIITEVINAKLFIKYHLRFSYDKKSNCYFTSKYSSEGHLKHAQYLSQKLVSNQPLRVYEGDYAFISLINSILKEEKKLQKYVITKYYEEIVSSDYLSEFALMPSNIKLIKEA